MNVRDFNVKTSSPDEDRLETVLHFVGEIFPRVFVINRLDREVDYVEVDGERFERVRECERILYKPTKVLVCSECGAGIPKQLDKYCYLHYCPNCGAKVKVGA